MTKKILNIATKILMCIVIAIAVFMMIFTIFSKLTFDRNDRSLFGIRFYIVLSDSMSPSENNKDEKVHFDAGDLILIKDVKDKTALDDTNIIAFISQNSENFGETVTHKIRERKLDDEGRLLGYVTYGTNTGVNDSVLVEPEYVLGEYSGKLPAVGHFFQFLKTTVGYVVCILIPFLLLIIYQGINTVRLFKRYKKEQMADVLAEREQIAKEREESAAMMKELLALREQLTRQTSGANDPADPPSEKPDDSETTDNN